MFSNIWDSCRSAAVDPYDGAISRKFIFEDGLELDEDLFVALLITEREDRVEGDHRFISAPQDAEVVETCIRIHRFQIYEHAAAKVDRLVIVDIDGIDVNEAGHPEFSVNL